MASLHRLPLGLQGSYLLAAIRRKRCMKSLSVIADLGETKVISRGLFSAPISDQGSGLFATLEPEALVRPLKILR